MSDDTVEVDRGALKTVLRFVRDDPALDAAPEDSPIPPAINQLADALDTDDHEPIKHYKSGTLECTCGALITPDKEFDAHFE